MADVGFGVQDLVCATCPHQGRTAYHTRKVMLSATIISSSTYRGGGPPSRRNSRLEPDRRALQHCRHGFVEEFQAHVELGFVDAQGRAESDGGFSAGQQHQAALEGGL